MISGMTGFGSSEFSLGEAKAILEIKSVNHRYLDISFYMPTSFGAIENKLRQIVQKELSRGRVTVALKITQKPAQEITLNKPAVTQYLKYARQITKEFSLNSELSFSDLINFPGVLEVKENFVDPQKVYAVIERNLRKSLRSLKNMRNREGKSLAVDLADNSKRMKVQLKKIQARKNIILKEKRKSLTEEEFVSFQKSSDVNEEMTRLAHYIDELKTLLKTNGSIGKNLDFIAQEMQRETNTIGSKLQDKVVSNAVIALKGKIEKIREQVQNVE